LITSEKGIVSKRKKWIDNLSYKNSFLWFLIAIAVIPLIVGAWIDLTKNTGTKKNSIEFSTLIY
jgi:hypothetical protein